MGLINEIPASECRLLKCPIVTDGGRKVTVGFKEAEFKKVWGKIGSGLDTMPIK